MLIPLASSETRVVIDLDGTVGYGSAFLEAAFGGVVRHQGWAAEQFCSRFDIVATEDTSYLTEILEYVEEAGRNAPTAPHPDPSELPAACRR